MNRITFPRKLLRCIPKRRRNTLAYFIFSSEAASCNKQKYLPGKVLLWSFDIVLRPNKNPCLAKIRTAATEKRKNVLEPPRWVEQIIRRRKTPPSSLFGRKTMSKLQKSTFPGIYFCLLEETALTVDFKEWGSIKKWISTQEPCFPWPQTMTKDFHMNDLIPPDSTKPISVDFWPTVCLGERKARSPPK